MEEAPVRKSDIPFMWSGIVCRVVMIGASASMLYGAFTDPAFRSGRPGIVDGIVGAALSVLLVRSLAGWLAVGWRRQFIAMRGDNLWVLRPHFDLAFAVTFFGSALLSAAAGFFLWHTLGLRWPWCGQQPTVLPGFLGFAIAFSHAYARWYGSLPE